MQLGEAWRPAGKGTIGPGGPEELSTRLATERLPYEEEFHRAVLKLAPQYKLSRGKTGISMAGSSESYVVQVHLCKARL